MKNKYNIPVYKNIDEYIQRPGNHIGNYIYSGKSSSPKYDYIYVRKLKRFHGILITKKILNTIFN